LLADEMRKLQRSLDPQEKFEDWVRQCRASIEQGGADLVLQLALWVNFVEIVETYPH